MSTFFFGSHELSNLVTFIAVYGPYAPRDGFRIYARIAADYSASSSRSCGFPCLHLPIPSIPSNGLPSIHFFLTGHHFECACLKRCTTREQCTASGDEDSL